MDLKELFEKSKDTHNWQWTTEPLTSAFIGCLIKMAGAKHVVEIGVFKGFTAANMVDAIPADGSYTGIDIENLLDPEIEKMIDAYGKSATMVIGDSIDVLPKLDKMDFVFIDGLHEFDHVVKEFKIIEKKISKGGIVCVHDSEHIPDVYRFIEWVKQFPHFEVVNLPTTDNDYHQYSRGLAVIRFKYGR